MYEVGWRNLQLKSSTRFPKPVMRGAMSDLLLDVPDVQVLLSDLLSDVITQVTYGRCGIDV